MSPLAKIGNPLMIVNCTPHPIDVYPADTPGIVDPAKHHPLLTIEPNGLPARLAEVVLDGAGLAPRTGAEAAIVVRVEYGHVTGLPSTHPRTWYVVSLPVALALPARRDLLVPYRQVRNAAGTVVGCRALARPE